MSKEEQKNQNQEQSQQAEKLNQNISGNEILGSKEEEKTSNRLSRRGFIGTAGAFGLGLLAMPDYFGKSGEVSAQVLQKICERAPLKGKPRADRAQLIRNNAAQYERDMPIPSHPCNNDDAIYATRNYYGSYVKGLKRRGNSYSEDFGEVDPNAYNLLLAALASGNPLDFEAIPLGCTSCVGVEFVGEEEVNDGDVRLSTDAFRPNLQRRLSSPQAGLNYDLEGKDYYQLINRPPRVDGAVAFPKAFNFASNEEAVEIIENYWQALTRDVAFVNYHNNPTVQAAASDLNQFFLNNLYFGPSDDRGIIAAVTPRVYSRGILPGDTKGPFLSQFFLRNIPYGAQTIPATIASPASGIINDFMTTPNEWRMIQTGQTPNRSVAPGGTRLIRNGRDLAAFVRNDAIYQTYLNAALLLVTAADKGGLGVPVNPNNPYRNYKKQANFVELGISHLLTLLGEVSVRAHKAVWYQKWNVHRRIRPEEFGGRIHTHLNGFKSYDLSPIIINSVSPSTDPPSSLTSSVFNRIYNVYNSFFLPQAFPEGSPVHPSYGAGHATLAGACVTLLKAWFDSEQPYLKFGGKLFEPNANGTGVQTFDTEDPRDVPTVADELNKLASNVSIGRNIAGVHWRSDYTESVYLGEQVAIHLLEDYGFTYNETFAGFRFRDFSGNIITVGGNR